MKIAICQMDIVWENKEENLKKAEEFIKKAADNDVTLICFPEMSFTGFSMNIENTKESNNETIEFIKILAKKYSISIAFGWVKDAGDKGENHYTIINEKGEGILDYIKIHPFSFSEEDKYFVSGRELKNCKIEDINISTFICYDLRFPEVFQSASKESSIIIVAAEWPEKRSEHWKCLLKARAIENQVYIIGVNTVGDKDGLYYSGDSCFIDPLGNILESISNKEGLIICDIKDDICKYRSELPVKKDRKVELYKRLL